MRVDLHTHTTASDGSLSPGALIDAAIGEGICLLAITDHDTLDGVLALNGEIPAASGEPPQLITGVEISACDNVEVHVLGYGVTPSRALLSRLSAMRAERETRMLRMIGRLNELGVSVTIEEVSRHAEGPLGRAHLARALMERGDVSGVREAFDRYLAPGKAAYAAREKLPVGQVIDVIRASGGVPVLAHPGLIPIDEGRLSGMIAAWRELGLMGIEAFHPGHSRAQCQRFERLAHRRGILITGGSDFHGKLKPGIRLGDGVAAWSRVRDDMALLREALKQASGAVN